MNKPGILDSLLITIPVKSINIIPEEIKGFYYPSSQIFDYFPRDYKIVDSFMIERESKYIPILPPIDFRNIFNIVSTMSLPYKRKMELNVFRERDRFITYGTYNPRKPSLLTRDVLQLSIAKEAVPKKEVKLVDILQKPSGIIYTPDEQQVKYKLEPYAKPQQIELPKINPTINQSPYATNGA
jgi:5'-3' exonuclease